MTRLPGGGLENLHLATFSWEQVQNAVSNGRSRKCLEEQRVYLNKLNSI